MKQLDQILKMNKVTIQVSRDIDNFERYELDHEQTFTEYNRLSCFSHNIQLVVAKFDEIISLKRVVKKAHKLVSKVNRSCKATEKLQTAQQG